MNWRLYNKHWAIHIMESQWNIVETHAIAHIWHHDRGSTNKSVIRKTRSSNITCRPFHQFVMLKSNLRLNANCFAVSLLLFVDIFFIFVIIIHMSRILSTSLLLDITIELETISIAINMTKQTVCNCNVYFHNRLRCWQSSFRVTWHTWWHS